MAVADINTQPEHPIAVIAGSGSLPGEVIAAARAQGRDVFVVAKIGRAHV